MTEIRIVKNRATWHKHGWNSTPNALTLDASISWDSKGAFGFFSLAADDPAFDVTAAALAAAGPRGRDHAQGMVRELEEHGWITRRRIPDPITGVPVVEYELHPVAVPEADRTFRPSTAKPRKRAFPQVKDENLDRQVSAPDQDDTSPSAPAADPPSEPPRVSAGQGRKPDRPGPGRSGPGRSGGLTVSPERTSFPPPSSSTPAEPTDGPTEGERERESEEVENTDPPPPVVDAPPQPAPEEWAIALVTNLNYGRHRRPNRGQLTGLARLVEAARDIHGLSDREITRHCRATLEQATKSGVKYLMGGLAEEHLPVPDPRYARLGVIEGTGTGGAGGDRPLAAPVAPAAGLKALGTDGSTDDWLAQGIKPKFLPSRLMDPDAAAAAASKSTRARRKLGRSRAGSA